MSSNVTLTENQNASEAQPFVQTALTDKKGGFPMPSIWTHCSQLLTACWFSEDTGGLFNNFKRVCMFPISDPFSIFLLDVLRAVKRKGKLFPPPQNCLKVNCRCQKNFRPARNESKWYFSVPRLHTHTHRGLGRKNLVLSPPPSSPQNLFPSSPSQFSSRRRLFAKQFLILRPYA